MQGHKNPFGKPLNEYSVAELDFILEMSALDDPEHWTFIRAAKQAVSTPKALARWIDVLAGPLAAQYQAYIGITAGLDNVRRWRARKAGGLQPGLSRAGKVV
jgi:hypothetical protein